MWGELRRGTVTGEWMVPLMQASAAPPKPYVRLELTREGARLSADDHDPNTGVMAKPFIE